jgi:hypothetical protein
MLNIPDVWGRQLDEDGDGLLGLAQSREGVDRYSTDSLRGLGYDDR